MSRILVIGSACADVSLYVDHLPSLEEDVEPFKQKISLGGCACNAAGILRLFDVPFTLFAPVGTGIYGNFVDQELKKRGIEPAVYSKEENGACYCLIDGQGNRTFLAVHGAEYRFEREWFDALDPDAFDAVYVCGFEIEEKTGDNIIDFLERCSGKTIWFAPGPRLASLAKEKIRRLFALHAIIHCNRREAAAYLQHPEYSSLQCAQELSAQTGNTVILTDGGNPAVYTENGKVYEVPSCPAHVIDGTGAGDAHIGAVMAMRAKEYPLAEAVCMANRIGAAMTETEGTILSAEMFAAAAGDAL